ncbi:MAG: aspartate carbamoyltransferase catalytic subunit [Legionellaceae bacterium]|nr:aspartate carbamoyltransferase catalytic subunit [Legionellaceae bacterium]
MEHFLDVTSLTRARAYELFERAKYFKQAEAYPKYPHAVILNVFYEDSTRTSLSFDLAAKKLGLTVLHLEPRRSSETKGESMLDMLQTVSAMGVHIVVMRHSADDVFEMLKDSIPSTLKLVNAGAGMFAHPTQAMLDVMTMLEAGVDLPNAKIAVVGDILHSRVAGSLQRLCAILGVGDLVFTGPSAWLPDVVEYGRTTDSLSEALADTDVVMTLRVQRERFTKDENLDFDAYRHQYAMTKKALQHAKKDALVMHPGPMNRGVEIDADVADGPQSYILKQVQNGVFIRMAILEALAQNI